MIDGGSHLRLVPHINRPEMYLGKTITDYNKISHALEVTILKKNESPVNLFSVDLLKYPNIQYAN